MTIREYAASRNITYEAARQAVEKAKPEIDKYIRKQGRTRYLLPEGEQLLDQKRKGTRITTLKKEAAEASDQIDDLTDKIDKLKNEIIVLQRQLLEANEKALEASVKAARLEAIADTSKKQEAEIEHLRHELGQYERSIFGFYRKRKQD